MSELAELERRIAGALERLGQAVQGLDNPSAASAAQAEAMAEAEAARADVMAAQAEAEAARAEAARLTAELDTETEVSGQLRDRIEALKTRKDEQAVRITELEKELADLKRARTEDRQELDDVIAALEPLVEEQPHA